MYISDDRYVYFIYSDTQLNFRKEIENRIYRDFVPGKVLVRGSYKKYTSMITDLSADPYSDSVIVAEGYLSQMEFYEPSVTQIIKKK